MLVADRIWPHPSSMIVKVVFGIQTEGKSGPTSGPIKLYQSYNLVTIPAHISRASATSNRAYSSYQTDSEEAAG